jgi:ATP-binding cassette subfamily B (MDR/TAP) protein 1
MLIGTVGAILAGLTFPAWGVIFAYMVELFYKQVACPPPLKPGFDTCEAYFDSEANSMRTLSFYLFYGYIGLCVTAVVGNITVFYGFSSASEKMNKKVRYSSR